MPFQSQLGQVGFAKQTAQGAAATLAAGAPSRWMKIRSTSVGADRSLVIPDAEIAGAGGRDRPKPYLSPASFSGTYEYYVRPEMIGALLFGVLGGGGGVPAGTATDGYTHTFTPADALPFFTIEESLGNGFDVFKYTDAQFNSLHLEGAADGYMMGNVGVVALDQTAGISPTATPGFDGSPQLVGTNIVVTYNGTQIPAESFSWDITNNIESDHFVLGSLTPDGLTPKRREISGNFTLRPTDNLLFRQAAFGNSAATAVTGNVTAQSFVITATSYEIIPGATTQVYSVQLTLPETVLNPFKPEASGEDTMSHSIDFSSVKIAAANAVSATVINGLSTAYNA